MYHESFQKQSYAHVEHVIRWGWWQFVSSSVPWLSKIKVIKEAREITGLVFKKAKDLADSAPKAQKKDVKKEEAEQIKDMLTKVGAVVEIVWRKLLQIIVF
jgi:predicted Zn-dependent protease